MKPALVVTHLEDRHTGLVAESLEAADCPVAGWNPLDHAPAPEADRISGIVSLGGRESATALHRHPFLDAEVQLMRAALDAGVPILGMCLGAQLLAVAAGGRVTTMARMNVGWPELSLLPDAGEDPVFGGLPSRLPVLKWHEDIIDLPPEGTALGSTEGPGAALFRIGPAAWGSQAHLELTPSMLLDGWLAEESGISEIESAGYEIDAFRAESRRRLEPQMAAARPVFERFAGLVRSRSAD
jgi:GMP synthase (glutamine-hydrolysing)